MIRLLSCLLIPFVLSFKASAQDYAALLSSGDAALAKQDFPAALADYAKAQEISTNAGERAFAIAKQALVKSEQKDYPAAKTLATQALEPVGLSPVCQVTALQALGVSQMRGERDFASAASSFERAVSLPGVEWAMPYLNLLLGDCLRETGDSSGALSAYEKVVSLPDSPPNLKATAWFNTGLEQQYRRRDSVLAREAYKNAIELNPSLKAEADKHMTKLP